MKIDKPMEKGRESVLRINLVPWPLYSLRTREGKINPKPAYQRSPVWSVSQKQLFIDSILRGYDIPKLYLRRIDKAPYEYEVVDGQQRMRTIWEFFRNEYPLSKDADAINGQEIGNKTYDELSDELKDIFQGYVLHFTVFEDADDEVITEMFIRLQNGVPLNSAEKRNAIGGEMRDFIHELAESHNFLTRSVGFGNWRYSHDEVVAQMMLVELNGRPCNVGYTQLKDMYERNKAFRTGGPKARRIKYVINFLAKAFPKKTPELTKVMSLSIYTLSSELLAKYAVAGLYKEFGQWLVDFEARRREDEARVSDQRDADLMQFQLYLSQATASQTALEHRHRVLMADVLLSIPSLKLLDDRRQFDYYQRLAIFRKYDGNCANPDNNEECSVRCEWDNFHADHIVPWSAGGRTTVSNGQLLCPNCNLKKGDTE